MTTRLKKTNVDTLDKEVREYLKSNKNLKESLKLFSFTKKEYINALQAKEPKQVVINTGSTGESFNGYVRGNSK